MKRIIVYCMMALSVFALINSNFIDAVNAEAGDVVFEDFDSYGTGATSGSNGYCSWARIEGTFETSTDHYYDSPLSLRSDNDGTNDRGYIQLHEATDINRFSFQFYFESNVWGSTKAGIYSGIDIYNETDDKVLGFKFDLLYNDIDVYGEGETYTSLYDDCAFLENEWLELGFSNNHTISNPANYIYFYFKNSTGNLIASVEIPSIYSEQVSSFEAYRIEINFSGGGLTEPNDMHFDYFVFNEGDQTGNPALTGIIIKQDDVTGIRDCDLYAIVNYDIIPTGGTYSRAVMQIINNDTSSTIYTNNYIIYPTYSAIHPLEIARSYGTVGNYSVHLYDYFYPSTGVGYWYEFEVTDSELLDPCPILNGVLITTNDIGGVQNTGSNEQVTYDLYLYGDVGCSALVKIYDDDGYIIYQHIFYKTSSVYEYEFYMNYNHAGDDFLFYVRDNKYGICDDAIFEDSEYFDVLNGSFIPDDYIDVYGDNFTIFYDNIGQSCYYQAGDSTKNRLQLLFLIPSAFKEAIGDYLHVRIWKVVGDQYTADTLVYSHSFYNDFDRLTFWEINTLYATEGTYRLYMYVAYNNVVNEMRFRETTIWEDYVDVCAYGGTNTNPYIPPDPYDPDSFGYGMLPPLSQPLGSIVGFIIVFVSLLIPIMIGGKVGTDIPMFVYAISGGTGLAVSSIMGFFPSWIIFFVVAVGIIAVFLTYFIGKTRGGE